MTEQQDENVAPDVDVTDEIQFGNYTIHELIGAGGMAEVFRATTAGPGGFKKAVVIKRVKPMHAKDKGFIQMFIDEAKLSAQLNHPNTVRVYEFGESDGNNYIVMEYIDGLHLQGLHVRHMQRKKAPLAWEAGLLCAYGVLNGLDYAHNLKDANGRPMGLIHRDINLVNVMVGRDGSVKILDFGIVKAADGIRSAETVGGVLKGKFGYMSPEQAEGRPLDPRSDVFSASIVLHELLTGRRLFYGKDDLEILRRVRGGEIPDPRKYAPDVPEALVQVTLKGLARRLEDRYQSAGDMAEALEEVIAENAVSSSLLRSLMDELMEAENPSATAEMALRRRKMTKLVWSAGVKEDEPLRPQVVSGVLQLDAATAPTELGDIQQHDTLITTQIRWLSPNQAGADIEPVLSEQAQAVLGTASGVIGGGGEPKGPAPAGQASSQAPGTGPAPGPDLAVSGQKTMILEDVPSLEPASTDQKTEILSGESVPDLAMSGQKTMILEDMPAPDLTLSDQETKILEGATQAELGLTGTAPAAVSVVPEASPTAASDKVVVDDQTDAPDEAAKGEAAKDEAAPDEAAPDEAAPDEAAPDEAARDEAPPDEAPPDEAPPDEAPPEEAAPEEAAKGKPAKGKPAKGKAPESGAAQARRKRLRVLLLIAAVMAVAVTVLLILKHT